MYIHKQKDLHFLMAIHFLAVLKADVKLNCIAKGKDFFFPLLSLHRGETNTIAF